jgi:cell division protein FtsB
MKKNQSQNKEQNKTFADYYQKPPRSCRVVSLFNRVLFCLIVFCIVYFVASINDLSVKSFILHDLQAQAREIENKNQAIELEIMRLQSYENISRRAKENRMVAVDEVEYITVMDGVVAKK